LDRPTSGQVELKGQDLATLSEQSLTRFRGKNIGLVFQQFHLMKHLTAIENVRLPFEILDIEGGQKKAEDLLTRLGLGHRLDHLTHQLSGGECQRVAIARAMMTEPALLLADEPSGNLDRETGEQVIDQLFEIANQKQLSLIVVTHSEELALRCERQLRLRDGVLHGNEGEIKL
jgi:putative ABC transport system ATP-binding protein